MESSLLKPEVIEFIKGHLQDDPFSLSLKANKLGLENAREVILQIQARQKASKKLPALAGNFEWIFPTPVSVEQASSEITATFKSKLFKGKTFADITGGMGIDTLFFADTFQRAIFVENDTELCQLAEHNFSTLGKKIAVINSLAEDFLSGIGETLDLIYVDPSRRDSAQKKVFKIQDCLPNVLDLEEMLLQKGKNVLIKLSPLADVKNAFSSFQNLKKMWVVSVKNECKELLCWLTHEKVNEGEIVAVNIDGQEEKEVFEFSLTEEENSVSSFSQPRKYIYEPNTSILKAGAFKSVGRKFGLAKLNINSHLYTSDRRIPFPGRVFELKEILDFDKKKLQKEWEGKRLHVVTRNFHLKAEEIVKKFKLHGGEDEYLIGTTLHDNSRKFLHCERIK